MKKLIYAFAIAALGFTMAACNKTAEKTEATDNAATEQNDAQAQAPEAQDIMVQAEAVVKKIDAGEEVNEADYNVVLDYIIDVMTFASENAGNADAMAQYDEKAKYMDKFNGAFETWFEKEDLQPETKAKIEKLTNLLQ